MGNNISYKILEYEKSAINNSNYFCCVSNNLKKSLIQNIQLDGKEKEGMCHFLKKIKYIMYKNRLDI